MRTTTRLPCLAVLAVLLGACAAPVVATPAGTAPSLATDPADHGTSTAIPSTGSGPAPIGRIEEAAVVRVVDGDTLIIDRGLGDERLRYIGIDAPESVKPDAPVEFMGHEASAANARLVQGRNVVLERDVSDRDRFDRLLRYVWLRQGDGWLLVNLELVRQGYAHAATFPPDVRLTDVLRDAERGAREAGLGLWGPATPPP